MSKTTGQFSVTTRDVDGSSVRTYKTLAAAAKRFHEMSGYTLQEALEERYADRVDAGLRVPSVESQETIRQVSDYGCVVTFNNALPTVEVTDEVVVDEATETDLSEGEGTVCCVRCGNHYAEVGEATGQIHCARCGWNHKSMVGADEWSCSCCTVKQNWGLYPAPHVTGKCLVCRQDDAYNRTVDAEAQAGQFADREDEELVDLYCTNCGFVCAQPLPMSMVQAPCARCSRLALAVVKPEGPDADGGVAPFNPVAPLVPPGADLREINDLIQDRPGYEVTVTDVATGEPLPGEEAFGTDIRRANDRFTTLREAFLWGEYRVVDDPLKAAFLAIRTNGGATLVTLGYIGQHAGKSAKKAIAEELKNSSTILAETRAKVQNTRDNVSVGRTREGRTEKDEPMKLTLTDGTEVTLTALEAQMVLDIVNDEYADGTAESQPWSWSVVDGDKATAAVLGSLCKKGVCGQQGKGRDASCFFTANARPAVQAYLDSLKATEAPQVVETVEDEQETEERAIDSHGEGTDVVVTLDQIGETEVGKANEASWSNLPDRGNKDGSAKPEPDDYVVLVNGNPDMLLLGFSKAHSCVQFCTLASGLAKTFPTVLKATQMAKKYTGAGYGMESYEVVLLSEVAAKLPAPGVSRSSGYGTPTRFQGEMRCEQCGELKEVRRAWKGRTTGGRFCSQECMEMAEKSAGATEAKTLKTEDNTDVNGGSTDTKGTTKMATVKKAPAKTAVKAPVPTPTPKVQDDLQDDPAFAGTVGDPDDDAGNTNAVEAPVGNTAETNAALKAAMKPAAPTSKGGKAVVETSKPAAKAATKTTAKAAPAAKKAAPVKKDAKPAGQYFQVPQVGEVWEDMNRSRGETVNKVFMPRMVGVISVDEDAGNCQVTTGDKKTTNRLNMFFKDRATTSGTPPIRQHGYCIVDDMWFDPKTNEFGKGEKPAAAAKPATAAKKAPAKAK